MVSHNVRGLNIPERRSSLLKELKKGKPHFVFLQETHFRTHHIPKLSSPSFPRVFHATNSEAKTRGVAIMINREAPFEISEQLCDPEGRYIFVRGSYGSKQVTLANVYFPNKAHITFCQKVVRELSGFARGCIIMGGGF